MEESFNLSSLEELKTSKPHKNEDLINWKIDISAVELNKTISVEQKLKADWSATLKQRELEASVKHELELSKSLLLEQYKSREQELLKQLENSRISAEVALKNRDDWWSAKLESVEKEKADLETRVFSLNNGWFGKLTEIEKRHREALIQVENGWKAKMAELQQQHDAYLFSLNERLEIENCARELSEKAKIEAKEEKFRQDYAKKIAKFEQQIQEVMEHYQKKETALEGAMEESRRELFHLQAIFEGKEAALRDELTYKDKRIVSMRGNLHHIDEILKIAEIWRSVAKQVASLVIQTCTSVQDLPEAPVKSPASPYETIYNSFLTTPTERSFKTGSGKEIDGEEYQEIKSLNVMVDRAKMMQCLKYSKKVIERIKAEIIPTYDIDYET